MKRYKRLFNETHPYYVTGYTNNVAERLDAWAKRNELAEEKSWYPSFKIIREAVIRSDKYVSLVIDEMRIFLKWHKNESFKYAFKICSLLNKQFAKYNFEFIERNEEGYDLISGLDEAVTLPNNFKIIFYCNMILKDLFIHEEIQKQFLIDFDKLLGHELIHRGQFLDTQDSHLRAEIFKVRPENTYKNKHDYNLAYFSRKEEIMAYAWMIIEELRFNGYTVDKILKVIKSDTIVKNTASMLDVYKSIFTIEDAQLKRLYKYMYEYITEKLPQPDNLLTVK